MAGRLILVTDAFNDVDDAVALYGLSKSDADCAGVVTTYGNGRIKAKAVSKFLRMAGARNVPVYYSKVWETKFKAPNEMDETDYRFLSENELLADNRYFGMNPGGEEFIADSVNSDAGNISVLSIAPLSALADAMRNVKNQKPRRIYVMGGHVGNYYDKPNAPYNHARIPEYNFACDPVAAREVLESGAEIFVVGKNLWTKNLFTPEDFEFLAEGTAAQTELLRMIKLRHANNQRTLAPLGIEAELFMYDPIATCAVLFPELYEFRKMKVIVDDKGLTHAEPTEEGNVYGAVSADLANVKKKVLSVLSG
ncbi:MAG: nucleoside hydrolase [Candidatus Aenigmarchaeota archaeon]|nr:nucleoside hydrolase [Candidatus Aenigmarchaeota archaeon]